MIHKAVSIKMRGGGNSHTPLSPRRKLPTSLFVAAALFMITALPPHTVSAESDSPRTDIIQNETEGTVSIIIDGEPVAVFSKDGLHVKGDLSFEGSMKDVGKPPSDEAVNKDETAGGAQ